MHYLVLVIGEDVAGQLEPYYQDLEVDKYLVGEVMDYDKEYMLKHYAERGEAFQDFDECYAKHGHDWNYNQYEKGSDGKWYEYSTFNPNAEWDWYQIGGRWPGRIKVKEGVEFTKPEFSWGWPEDEKAKILAERRTDSARIRDIDNLDELKMCYAVVMDYEWIGGVTEDEVEKILKDLDPSTRITFVDCHM